MTLVCPLAVVQVIHVASVTRLAEPKDMTFGPMGLVRVLQCFLWPVVSVLLLFYQRV